MLEIINNLTTSDIITIIGITVGVIGLITGGRAVYKIKQKNKSTNNTNNSTKNIISKSQCNNINQAQNINITNNNYQTPIESTSRNVITITQETNIYGNTAMKGNFEFNYSNNNGTYIIGENEFTFTTKWSKASDVSIHAYNDAKDIDSIALLKAPVNLDDTKNISGDFSSRCRTPQIDDAIVWRNNKGKLMITKIIEIDDDTRGSKSDRLKCEYVILC